MPWRHDPTLAAALADSASSSARRGRQGDAACKALEVSASQFRSCRLTGLVRLIKIDGSTTTARPTPSARNSPTGRARVRGHHASGGAAPRHRGRSRRDASIHGESSVLSAGDLRVDGGYQRRGIDARSRWRRRARPAAPPPLPQSVNGTLEKSRSLFNSMGWDQHVAPRYLVFRPLLLQSSSWRPRPRRGGRPCSRAPRTWRPIWRPSAPPAIDRAVSVVTRRQSTRAARRSGGRGDSSRRLLLRHVQPAAARVFEYIFKSRTWPATSSFLPAARPFAADFEKHDVSLKRTSRRSPRFRCRTSCASTGASWSAAAAPARGGRARRARRPLAGAAAAPGALALPRPARGGRERSGGARDRPASISPVSKSEPLMRRLERRGLLVARRSATPFAVLRDASAPTPRSPPRCRREDERREQNIASSAPERPYRAAPRSQAHKRLRPLGAFLRL